jgi:hypothetical protein
MNKETFYFSHDYNSRNDVKIKKLLSKHGLLGYGIFWAIIEELYNNTNVLPLDYDTISYDLRIDKSVLISVINDYDLFVFDGDTFGSLSVERRLKERDERSHKARQSVLKRWNKAKEDTNVLQSNNEPNTIKEIKGNEIKGKDIPDFNSFLSYAIKQKPNVDTEAVKFKYESWIENNWKDGYGVEIINWKNKLLNTLPHIKEKQIKYDPTNPRQMIL